MNDAQRLASLTLLVVLAVFLPTSLASADNHIVTASGVSWLYRGEQSGVGRGQAITVRAAPGDTVEFRQSAGPGLESGVLALLEGDETGFATMLTSIVGGLFDIFEPDSSSGN